MSTKTDMATQMAMMATNVGFSSRTPGMLFSRMNTMISPIRVRFTPIRTSATMDRTFPPKNSLPEMLRSMETQIIMTVRVGTWTVWRSETIVIRRRNETGTVRMRSPLSPITRPMAASVIVVTNRIMYVIKVEFVARTSVSVPSESMSLR